MGTRDLGVGCVLLLLASVVAMAGVVATPGTAVAGSARKVRGLGMLLR